MHTRVTLLQIYVPACRIVQHTHASSPYWFSPPSQNTRTIRASYHACYSNAIRALEDLVGFRSQEETLIALELCECEFNTLQEALGSLQSSLQAVRGLQLEAVTGNSPFDDRRCGACLKSLTASDEDSSAASSSRLWYTSPSCEGRSSA